jgi:hypothetical protein
VINVSAGQRLHSRVCTTEVIVVLAPDHHVELTCGGRPMATDRANGAVAASSAGGSGTQLGKRYIDEAAGLEVLCVKPGSGSLAADGRDLTLKSATPLPASD